jgi:hypothetical protein
MSPQHDTVPSSRKPHVCAQPVETRRAVFTGVVQPTPASRSGQLGSDALGPSLDMGAILRSSETGVLVEGVASEAVVSTLASDDGSPGRNRACSPSPALVEHATNKHNRTKISWARTILLTIGIEWVMHAACHCKTALFSVVSRFLSGRWRTLCRVLRGWLKGCGARSRGPSPVPACLYHRRPAHFIGMGRVILVGASTVMVFVMLACSSSNNQPTDQDRAAWQNWAFEFVATVCAHQTACSPDGGRSPGSENACVETGGAGADKATCGAAVEFYVAHRAALEACTSNYPHSCSLSVVDACPTMPAGDFGTLCP